MSATYPLLELELETGYLLPARPAPPRPALTPLTLAMLQDVKETSFLQDIQKPGSGATHPINLEVIALRFMFKEV